MGQSFEPATYQLPAQIFKAAPYNSWSKPIFWHFSVWGLNSTHKHVFHVDEPLVTSKLETLYLQLQFITTQSLSVLYFYSEVSALWLKVYLQNGIFIGRICFVWNYILWTCLNIIQWACLPFTKAKGFSKLGMVHVYIRIGIPVEVSGITLRWIRKPTSYSYHGLNCIPVWQEITCIYFFILAKVDHVH